MQRTLNGLVELEGVGLHGGRPARLRLRPAPADHGIVFRRTDLPGDQRIPALWHLASPAPLCTRIQNPAGARVTTIEHLMAALSGLGIDNALVEIDAEEVPILDGSAQRFAAALLRTGTRAQAAPLRVIEVLRPVEVAEGPARAALLPANPARPGLSLDFRIDFADPAIARQHLRLDMANGTFLHELADSRTFCLQADVARMHREGRALGGTLNNALVFDRGRLLTPGGLRHKDEPVRHKMLDAMGDLALAGAPLLARYRAERAGHSLTNRLLHALFAQPGAWRLIDCPPDLAAQLPGRGDGSTPLQAVA